MSDDAQSYQDPMPMEVVDPAPKRGRPAMPTSVGEVVLHQEMYKFGRKAFTAVKYLGMDLAGLDLMRRHKGCHAPSNPKRKLHPMLQMVYQHMEIYHEAEDDAVRQKALDSAFRAIEAAAKLVDSNAREVVKHQIDLIKMRSKGIIKEGDMPKSDAQLLKDAESLGITVESINADDE